MVSAESGFDQDVDLLMTCILAQGLPSTVVGITDLEKIPLKVSSYLYFTSSILYFVQQENTLVLRVTLLSKPVPRGDAQKR